MTNIRIVIENAYVPNIQEEFIYPCVDISNEEEVEEALAECCEEFLDIYHDYIGAKLYDLPVDSLMEGFKTYLIEEFIAEEVESYE